MTDHADLIAILRQKQNETRVYAAIHVDWLRAAANAIEALVRERDEARLLYSEWHGRANDLEALLREARAYIPPDPFLGEPELLARIDAALPEEPTT